MDETQKEENVLAFPLPPSNYKHYAPELLAANRTLPPPRPMKGPYKMFGAEINPHDPIISKLESQNIRKVLRSCANSPAQPNNVLLSDRFITKQRERGLIAHLPRKVYPSHLEHKREMKNINHAILTNYLDLLQILIANPESPSRTEKLNDLETLFINFHHLINEYRPHQAKETVRAMMQLQISETKELTKKLKQMNSDLKGLVTTRFDKDKYLPKVSLTGKSHERNIAATAGNVEEGRIGNSDDVAGARTVDEFCSLIDSGQFDDREGRQEPAATKEEERAPIV